MKDAVKEKRSDGGMEMPIEVYDICDVNNGVRTVRDPHYHEYIEFLYAYDECEMDVWISGETVRLGTGDMIVINANTPHTFENRILKSSYVCVKALPQFLYSSASTFYDMRYTVPFFENRLTYYRCFPSVELGEIPALFLSLMKEWSGREFGYEITVKGLLLQIFSQVVRMCYARGTFDGSVAIAFADENMRIIQRSVEFINENYMEISEAEVANLVNMSYSHFSRQFKRVTGRSFRDHVSIVRISVAEKLLLTTEMPITEIALATGFATSSHFIDTFKRYKSMTPAKYRQFLRKIND